MDQYVLSKDAVFALLEQQQLEQPTAIARAA